MNEKILYPVDSALAGQRLDRIIALILPECGLRKSRRLIENGFATIDGRLVSPGFRPTQGQILAIQEKLPEISPTSPFLIDVRAPYSFFFKPRGMHTVNVAGSRQATLENWVEENSRQETRLLQRLDFATCGIVCGARSIRAIEDFRKYEESALCAKFYICLLDGTLSGPARVKNELDVKNRKKTKALPREAPAARHTVFMPLPDLPAPLAGTTWAVAKISRGQRHQIRAHAALLGAPLANDGLYGTGNGQFFLRHFHLSFPGCSFTFLEECPGDFQLPPGAKEALANVEIIFSNRDFS